MTPEYVSEFDRTHVGEILAGHGSWFGAHLLRLIAKADADNLQRIDVVFPEHVSAYLAWRDNKVTA